MNRLVISKGTEQSERLQHYLNEATRRIARAERSAKRISGENEAIIELSRMIADSINPGERDSLLQLLKQASLRKNIVNKLEGYTNQIIFAREVNMSADKYTNYGGAGAFGPNATVSNVEITNNQQAWTSFQSKADTSALAEQLDKLLISMQAQSKTTVELESLVAVSAARDAAKQSDGPSIMSHLKKAGDWAKEIAEKIGVDVAVKAITAATGIPTG
jgi:hypothetical protein